MSREVDCDICADCKEHAEFYCCVEATEGKDCASDCEGDVLSNCCASAAYQTQDWGRYD